MNRNSTLPGSALGVEREYTTVIVFSVSGAILIAKDTPTLPSGAVWEYLFYNKTERHNHDGNDDKPIDIRTALNEIDSKEHLINVSEKYRMPLEETVLTKQQLEYYKNLLEELEGKK